jgi:hypothetical protein
VNWIAIGNRENLKLLCRRFSFKISSEDILKEKPKDMVFAKTISLADKIVGS